MLYKIGYAPNHRNRFALLLWRDFTLIMDSLTRYDPHNSVNERANWLTNVNLTAYPTTVMPNTVLIPTVRRFNPNVVKSIFPDILPNRWQYHQGWTLPTTSAIVQTKPAA